MEIPRMISMYKENKMKEVLLIPLFDSLTMMIYLYGLIISLIKIKEIPKA